MLYFAARRVFLAVCVCATVLVVSFALTRLSVDRAGPLSEQLFDWVWAALHGDLGRSVRDNAAVSALIWAAAPVTLQLGLISIVMALAVAVPAGILAATYEGTVTDHGLGLLALIVQAMPAFWLGLLLSLWLGLDLQWLPIQGLPMQGLPILGADTWQVYVLPAMVLAFSAIPALMRLTRSGMIDALSSDYARTARAKGVEQLVVVLKHALRNAAVPVVTTTLAQLGKVLGGSIVIEVVFSLHGIGYLAWDSIIKNDVPVVHALVLLLAAIYIMLALFADMLNAWLDPDLRGGFLSPAELTV